jgi:hypothetical protein
VIKWTEAQGDVCRWAEQFNLEASLELIPEHSFSILALTLRPWVRRSVRRKGQNGTGQVLGVEEDIGQRRKPTVTHWLGYDRLRILRKLIWFYLRGWHLDLQPYNRCCICCSCVGLTSFQVFVTKKDIQIVVSCVVIAVAEESVAVFLPQMSLISYQIYHATTWKTVICIDWPLFNIHTLNRTHPELVLLPSLCCWLCWVISLVWILLSKLFLCCIHCV